MRSLTSDQGQPGFIMTEYAKIEWWIVSVGPKNKDGNPISIEREDLIVWDGCRPIFVVTRKGTELRDWFNERGVDVHDEIEWVHYSDEKSSVFRIQPSQSVGVEARLTFPSRFAG